MEVEPLWRSRLRWRFRGGALLWPLFVVLTVVDGLLLGVLPIAGETGTEFVPGALLGMFLNLVAIAVVAPFVTMLVRRRRRALPFDLARDTTATVLLGVVTLGLLAGGLIHRPKRHEVQRDFAAQLVAAQRYAHTQAPPEFRRRVGEATSLRVDEKLYRTCVPGPDPRRWFCMYVATDSTPPGITVDRARESNASLNGVGGFRR